MCMHGKCLIVFNIIIFLIAVFHNPRNSSSIIKVHDTNIVWFKPDIVNKEYTLEYTLVAIKHFGATMTFL